MNVGQAHTLIRNFENAARNHEMMGAQHPQDWPQIEADLKRTKKALLDALTKENTNG